MILEYLGRIGYGAGGNSLGGFMVGIDLDINGIIESHKKVVVLGCGENSFYVEKFLQERGLEVYAYADSSTVKQGASLRGKKIYSPYAFMEDEDAYFIIATGNIAGARLQFMTHDVNSYSVFLTENFHDFTDEDEVIQKALMKSINLICFDNETAEEAMPYDAWGNRKRLGNVNWLLGSTSCSHYVYHWAKKYIEDSYVPQVLEIGPGFGLMSSVLLNMDPNMSIDWTIFGDPDYVWDMGKKPIEYEVGLRKVKQAYDKRINMRYGYIEESSFSIEKKYDLIILTEVFEHFALNPIKTMKKLAEALTEDGRILLTTPNGGFTYFYEKWNDMPDSDTVSRERYLQLVKAGHVWQYTKAELEDIFARVGLEIEAYKVSENNCHNIMLKKR